MSPSRWIAADVPPQAGLRIVVAGGPVDGETRALPRPAHTCDVQRHLREHAVKPTEVTVEVAATSP